VRRDLGFTDVQIVAQTKVTGFDEYGLPHIVEGDALHATVHECTASGRRYKVVADSIERQTTLLGARDDAPKGPERLGGGADLLEVLLQRTELAA
jgi:hypothetical protein